MRVARTLAVLLGALALASPALAQKNGQGGGTDAATEARRLADAIWNDGAPTHPSRAEGTATARMLIDYVDRHFTELDESARSDVEFKFGSSYCGNGAVFERAALLPELDRRATRAQGEPQRAAFFLEMAEWCEADDERAIERKKAILALRIAAFGEHSEQANEKRRAIADLLLDRGRSDEALGYLRRAIADEVQQDGAISKSFWPLLNALAREGGFAEIDSHLRPVVDYMRQRWARDGGPLGALTREQKQLAGRYAALLTRYAGNLAMLGRGDEADAEFRRALDLGIAVDGPDADNTGHIYNQWSYYLNLIGRFAAAEAPGRKAADIWLKTRGAGDIGTAKARYNYATALLGQGKAAQALPYYREALPVQLATGPEDHPDLAILLTTTARAESMIAGEERAALSTAERAATIVRTRRDRRLAGSGAGGSADPGAVALARAVARQVRSDPLASAYDVLLLAAWKQAADPRARSDAFVALQDLTLSTGGQAMSDAAARNLAGTAALGTLVRERQDLARDLAPLMDAYNAALGKGDRDAAAALKLRLDGSAAKLRAADERLHTEFPAYDQLVAPRAVDLSATRKLLAPDEAVLLLLPSEGHVYSFAVGRDAVAWNRLDNGAADVAAMAARVRCRIDQATCSDADYNAAMDAEARGGASTIDAYYPRYDRGTAYALYDRLIRPVEPALAGAKRVYVVASGPIGDVPLAMLVAAPPRGDPESGAAEDLIATPWLGDRYAFVTLPSVSALTLGQQARRTGGGFIGYGAPALDGKPAEAAAARGAGRRLRGAAPVRAADFLVAAGDTARADPARLRTLSPLPGTERELRRIAAETGGSDASLRLGPAATERAVKTDPALPRAAVIAFATHGLLPGEAGKGEEAGLVLTPPSTAADAADDGLLTASEAAALSLDADWLVLSACNTATGDGQPGADALSGLARSFLYAGARSLLASHWRVSDDATAALTVETLALDRKGQSTKAAMLQQAERTVRTGVRADGSKLAEWQPFWAHPAAWAPFTLITNRDR